MNTAMGSKGALLLVLSLACLSSCHAKSWPWRLRIAGGRDCPIQFESLRYFNKTCSSHASPRLSHNGVSKSWKGWVLEQADSSDYELVNIRPYNMPSRNIKCKNSYIRPYPTGCNSKGVAMHGTSGNWRLLPVAGKTNTFHIVVDARGAGCNRYLGARPTCNDDAVTLYRQPQGLLTQWIISPYYGGDQPPVISSTRSYNSSVISLVIDKPRSGPPPAYYRVLYKKASSTVWIPLDAGAHQPLGSSTSLSLQGLSKCTTYNIKVKGYRSFPYTETPSSAVANVTTKCSEAPSKPEITAIDWSGSVNNPLGDVRVFEGAPMIQATGTFDDSCAAVHLGSLLGDKINKYCVGATRTEGKEPENYSCMDALVMGDAVYICSLDKTKKYFFAAYTVNAAGKSPVAITKSAVGPLRAVVTAMKAVPNTCSVDIYVDVETDPLLGPLDFRVVVVGNSTGTLVGGTNEPTSSDPLRFRLPAENDSAYKVTVEVGAGLKNAASDVAFFKYDGTPDMCAGGY